MLTQILVTIFVLFALSRAYLQFRNNNTSLGSFLFWVLIWGGVLFIVYWPNLFNRVAGVFGIQRSIDVVVYFAIISLFYLIFRSYVKIQELEQNITHIVRQIALKDISKK